MSLLPSRRSEESSPCPRYPPAFRATIRPTPTVLLARNDGTPERSARRSRAARDRRFRPCRKGSAFLQFAPRANPFRPFSSTLRAPLRTHESPQPLSHHALAHNFRHTPGWGSHLSNQRRRPSVALPPARLATLHSPLPAILFTICTFAKHAPNLFGMRSFKTQNLKGDYAFDTEGW